MNAASAPSTHSGPFATLFERGPRHSGADHRTAAKTPCRLRERLVAGGVRVLEVTLRTPVAIEAAKAIIAEVPEAIVGIGTILNPDDLARAQALGAKFGISPGAHARTAEGRR